MHVPLLRTVGSYHSFLRLGALTALNEPSLTRVGSGAGAAGRSIQIGNNELLATIDLHALSITSSDIWIRSGDLGAARLALNMSSFSTSENAGTNVCIKANGGELGACFETEGAWTDYLVDPHHH